MKTLITIIIVIGLFLYISELSVSFRPFSVSLPYWYRGLGIFLVVVGFLVYNVGERAKGYADGLNSGYELTVKTIKEMAKNKEPK